MSNHANSQPWWTRTNKQTLDDRVRSVQNVNDPTIISDDVQRWSKLALMALLGFTTLLSGFSYFKFFEKSFGFALALVMALLLATIIEFGKNWGFLKVLRIPFFQGWGFVWREVSNTVMWVFLLFLSIVTFAASVYNSTQGAHQLSLLLSHERTYNAFQPNTAALDGQISDLQKKDGELNLKLKNGRTNWAAQPIKAENAKTLASLQQQRETAIAQQRADWEKQNSVQEQQNNFSANSLLAVGGWVELLQIILMFVRAAAERSLDKTASQRSGQHTASTPLHQSPSGHQQHNGQAVHNTFFNRQADGSVRSALPSDELTPHPLFQPDDDTETPVSQSPPTVTQVNTAENTGYADDVLKLSQTRLQGFAANFDGVHRNNATVASNIHRILDETLVKMKGTFRPSVQTHAKFSAYVLDVLFPLLRDKGFPYPQTIQFSGWLRTVAPVVIT